MARDKNKGTLHLGGHIAEGHYLFEGQEEYKK